jgi:hypothetical protein
MLHERRRTPNSGCSIWGQTAQASGEGLSGAGRDVRCTARRSTAVVAPEPDDYSVDRFGHTGASVRYDGRAFAAHPRKRRDRIKLVGFRVWHFPDIADLADDVCFVGAKRTS